MAQNQTGFNDGSSKDTSTKGARTKLSQPHRQSGTMNWEDEHLTDRGSPDKDLEVRESKSAVLNVPQDEGRRYYNDPYEPHSAIDPRTKKVNGHSPE